MTAKRGATGAAVAGLFAEPSATGGLAGHGERANPRRRPDTRSAPEVQEKALTRVRLGVELTEQDTSYLRSLSRPNRTGEPRTLGSKFVATAVLAAAVELLKSVDVDMHGVAAGDLTEMTQRARDALSRAARE